MGRSLLEILQGWTVQQLQKRLAEIDHIMKAAKLCDEQIDHLGWERNMVNKIITDKLAAL